MAKLNACLLILALLSALSLISIHSQTRGYFDRVENQKRLVSSLEEEHRLMLLKRAKLTNINDIKKKAAALGMLLPSLKAKRVLKAGN